MSGFSREKKKIGQILMGAGLIVREQLEEAIQYQQKYGGGLTQYLVSFGYLREEDLAGCVSRQYGLPYLSLKILEVPKDVIRLLSPELVKKHCVIPVDRNGHILSLVMFDPWDEKALEEIKEHTKCDIRPYVGTLSEIAEAMEHYYGVCLGGKKLLQKEASAPEAYTGRERRRAVRLEVALGLKIDLQSRSVDCLTRNISALGVYFVSPESFLPGTYLNLLFELPPAFYSRRLEAEIQVVHRQDTGGKKHGIGAVFTKIGKRQLSVLLEYAWARDKADKSAPGRDIDQPDVWGRV